MGSTHVPHNEAARLDALLRYEVLDSPAEDAFDEIAKVAGYIAQTPTALVTLVDTKRQWFKSKVAFGADESARDIAFCAHTILQTEVMMVRDATRDPRFATNPLVVSEPYIRFYAGAPLITPDGFAIGSLAVIDYVPRELHGDQLTALRSLSRQVVAQLELRRRLTAENRTLREHAREQIQQSEERYRALIEDVPDAIFTLSATGTIASANRAAEEILGGSRDEWLGRPFAPFVDAPDRPRAIELLSRVLAGEKQADVELRLLTSDGLPVSMEFIATPQRSGGRVVSVLAVGRDVTARKRMEEQLRQSQKMEAIGQLSSGVAHDFNNLLTVIHCNATLLVDEERIDPGEVREQAQEIVEAADRAAGLTRQLLMLSRQQAMRPTMLDLNDVVQTLLRMLQRIVGEDIHLRTEYAEALPRLYGDVGMLEQVLLNLVVNARDAMPRGGEVTITTSIGGPGVYLTVRDSGVGIPPDVLAHIFEPFFTTKPVGKGTGLGLATVAGIVKQHGGSVEVESEPGKGTLFRVGLPLTDRAGVDATRRDSAESLSGSETVLVVEDEAAVRSVVVSVLKRRGYTVLEASSGAAALDVARTYDKRIALLLTDLVMPGGINGFELAESLRRERPELRVIYTSGYSADLAPSGVALIEGYNFLQKPFQPRKLAQTVRARLDHA